MKKTKLLVLILSLALLVSGIVGISASAADADSTVAIEGKSISYMEVSTLVVAVSYENAELAEVKLNVWYGEKAGDPTVLTTTETIEVGGKACAMFVLDGTPAKNVADRVYYEAFIEGTEVKTALESYSVLEYALEGVVNSADAAEAARYQSIITYATSIQEWLKADGKFDGTLAKDYSYVQIEGGTLDGTSTYGVFANGTTITPVGEDVVDWDVTVNGVSNTVASGAEIEITGNTKITANRSVLVEDNTALDFEDGNIPTALTPTISSSSYGSATVQTVTGADGNTENKALVLNSTSNVSNNTLKFDFTKTAENCNTVVFEADFKATWDSTIAGNRQFLHFYINDKNGNTAEWSMLRASNSSTLVLYTRDSQSGSFYNTTAIGAQDTWYNIRFEYTVIDTLVRYTVFVNDTTVNVTDKYYSGTTPIAASDIESFVIKTNIVSGHQGVSTVTFDNVRFEQTNLASPETFENVTNIPSNIKTMFNSGSGDLDVVTTKDKNGDKTNALKLEAGGNDWLLFNVAKPTASANALVFDTDIYFDSSSQGTLDLQFARGTSTTFAMLIDMNANGAYLRTSDGTTIANVGLGEADKWINLRVELVEVSSTSATLTVYVDGVALENVNGITVTTRYDIVTDNDNDATNTVFFKAWGSTNAKVLFDNVKFEEFVAN